MDLGIDPAHVAGFEAVARGGPLGVVVDATRAGRSSAPDHLLVRGGVSEALYYHVPIRHVTSVFPVRRALAVDVETDDFAPRLRPDGSVDLYVY